MTTTSSAPAPSPCEQPDEASYSPGPARDDTTLLQDAAAARSWGAVDRRRDPRRRHR